MLKMLSTRKMKARKRMMKSLRRRSLKVRTTLRDLFYPLSRISNTTILERA